MLNLVLMTELGNRDDYMRRETLVTPLITKKILRKKLVLMLVVHTNIMIDVMIPSKDEVTVSDLAY